MSTPTLPRRRTLDALDHGSELPVRLRIAVYARISGLAGRPDAAAVWVDLSLERKRAVVAAVVEVTVLPARRGGTGAFDPAFVRLRARIGDRVVLVSVGGVDTAEDAWTRLQAGATLVQAYTGFVYGGPLWPRRIHAGLAQRARQTGLTSISDVEVTGSASP